MTLTGAETDVQEELDLGSSWARGSAQGPVPVLRRRRVADIRHRADKRLGRLGKQHVRLLGARIPRAAISSASSQPRVSTGVTARTRNSEIAFNNNVLTEDGAAGGGPRVVHLTNISILDDTGTPFHSLPTSSGRLGSQPMSLWQQGGTINMANFPLTPTHVPYALMAEDLNPDGGLVPPATVPFGLPFTQVPNPLAIFTPGGRPDPAAYDFTRLGERLHKRRRPGGVLATAVAQW